MPRDNSKKGKAKHKKKINAHLLMTFLSIYTLEGLKKLVASCYFQISKNDKDIHLSIHQCLASLLI